MRGIISEPSPAIFYIWEGAGIGWVSVSSSSLGSLSGDYGPVLRSVHATRRCAWLDACLFPFEPFFRISLDSSQYSLELP